jgi:hypothetical protein
MARSRSSSRFAQAANACRESYLRSLKRAGIEPGEAYPPPTIVPPTPDDFGPDFTQDFA